jgi:hypothetical protein
MMYACIVLTAVGAQPEGESERIEQHSVAPPFFSGTCLLLAPSRCVAAELVVPCCVGARQEHVSLCLFEGTSQTCCVLCGKRGVVGNGIYHVSPLFLPRVQKLVRWQCPSANNWNTLPAAVVPLALLQGPCAMFLTCGGLSGASAEVRDAVTHYQDPESICGVSVWVRGARTEAGASALRTACATVCSRGHVFWVFRTAALSLTGVGSLA